MLGWQGRTTIRVNSSSLPRRSGSRRTRTHKPQHRRPLLSPKGTHRIYSTSERLIGPIGSCSGNSRKPAEFEAYLRRFPTAFTRTLHVVGWRISAPKVAPLRGVDPKWPGTSSAAADGSLPAPSGTQLLTAESTALLKPAQTSEIAEAARTTAEEQVALVRRAQASLAHLGYQIGIIDSVVGSRTRNALSDMWRKLALPRSRDINFASVEKLEAAVVGRTTVLAAAEPPPRANLPLALEEAEQPAATPPPPQPAVVVAPPVTTLSSRGKNARE